MMASSSVCSTSPVTSEARRAVLARPPIMRCPSCSSSIVVRFGPTALNCLKCDHNWSITSQ